MSNKTKNLVIRLTEKDLNQIKANSIKSKLSVSKYVRKACLNKPIVVIEDLKQFSKQLHGIGNNLNQVVVLAHQGKIKNINLIKIEELLTIINQIWDTLDYIMKER